MLDVLENLIVRGICLEGVCSGGLLGIFGNPVFLALFGILFVIGLAFALRLNIDVIILSAIMMFFILAKAGLLPQWTYYLIMVGAGFLIALMLKRLLGR